MRFPVGALPNEQKHLMERLRTQALTSLSLALGTAIGVEGAKSLPARIQGQSRRTVSGDTGRVLHKNVPDMFCVKRRQSTVCEAEASAREVHLSCQL
jgi:hypothetical protein